MHSSQFLSAIILTAVLSAIIDFVALKFLPQQKDRMKTSLIVVAGSLLSAVAAARFFSVTDQTQMWSLYLGAPIGAGVMSHFVSDTWMRQTPLFKSVAIAIGVTAVPGIAFAIRDSSASSATHSESPQIEVKEEGKMFHDDCVMQTLPGIVVDKWGRQKPHQIPLPRDFFD